RRFSFYPKRVLLVGGDVVELGVAQERLGGDAPDVEAHPAPVLGLDHRSLEPQLRGADRRHVAAKTSTEEDNIEVSHGRHPTDCPSPATPATRLPPPPSATHAACARI